MTVSGASQRIQTAVLSWAGVEAVAHRFPGTDRQDGAAGVEFRIGRREIGHIHGDGLVDIPFPTKVRDELVAAGLAQPHHVLPESGWISFRLRREEDVQAAIDLLKRSYNIAAKQKRLESK
jgi:hypothetical protein